MPVLSESERCGSPIDAACVKLSAKLPLASFRGDALLRGRTPFRCLEFAQVKKGVHSGSHGA